MIDIKLLRQQPQKYKDSANRRGIKVDIDALLKLDEQRGPLITQVDELRSKLKLKGKPSAAEQKELHSTKSDLEKLQAQLTKLDTGYVELLSAVPNLLAEGTPDGGEESNTEEDTWGKAATQKGARDHQELALANDWLDFDRGTKVAGAKFYFMKGAAVRLELALVRMVTDLLERHKFTLMSVPHLASTRIMNGTGFNPRGEEKQIYEIADTDLNLIATAEIPLTGYHADEIIDPAKLPLLYAGYSPSYRQEAGAYGKHSKGLYRVHQFNKLEMYVFCAPDQSNEWHQKLVAIEEDICKALEIPYRRVRIAAGDLGAPAYKKYDIEYWSPVEGKYRELTSCSNVTDYQARRLNIRTRDKDGKTVNVHTLNGTAMAYSRTFIALIENHQTPEGGVRIPQALQPYYGSEVL